MHIGHIAISAHSSARYQTSYLYMSQPPSLRVSAAHVNQQFARRTPLDAAQFLYGEIAQRMVNPSPDVTRLIDRLARRQVRHKVMVVGAGPARDWFEKRLPDACFVGHQEGTDLGRAVASMDILFNPSVTETFGNVTLEAMAAGLPVVAARATGSESLVTDGLTGRLVRPGACDQFCEALSHYCSDEESRHAAGRAGCEASKRYGWDEINHELIDAYIRIIRQHQSGGRQPRHSPVP